MNPEDLRQILIKEESLKIDFKREYKFFKPRSESVGLQIWNQYVDGQWDEFIKDILALTNGNVNTADQTGYLIIGAGDQLKSDGSRDLFDTSDSIFDSKQIIAKVNEACHPPIPEIIVNQIELDGKIITVIEIPPSPHIHETTRRLEIPEAYFDEDGNLKKVDLRETTIFNENTVFVRRNEAIGPAQQKEIQAMQNERWKLYGVSEFELEPRGLMPRLIKKLKDNWVLAALIFIIFTFIPTALAYRDELVPLFEEKIMQGEFNIAISEFSVIDQDGSAVRSEDGKQMAQFLYERMDSAYGELGLTNIDFEIWGPKQTGKIKGDNPEERAQAAEALAQEIGAHVLIYGTIITGENSNLMPEFYVNYQGFEQATEITGQHELGKSLRVVLPFDAHKIQDIENPALSARANALSLITIGLAYYSIDDLEQALSYYQQAENIDGWLQNAGKEVLYLLIGNANMRLSSTRKSTQYFEPGMKAFNTALEINPDYARAKIGQAGVLYLIALGDPGNPSFDTVDMDKLSEAEIAYLRALELGNPPESANIPTKVNFGLGQINLVRNQVTGNDDYQASIKAFEEVIQSYENGNIQIVDYASHAYARLGIIHHLAGNNDLAVDYYHKAIEIASPAYQASNWATLGEIYLVVGQHEDAVNAYHEAIQIAEFYGDEESVIKYSIRLSEIE